MSFFAKGAWSTILNLLASYQRRARENRQFAEKFNTPNSVVEGGGSGVHLETAVVAQFTLRKMEKVRRPSGVEIRSISPDRPAGSGRPQDGENPRCGSFTSARASQKFQL